MTNATSSGAGRGTLAIVCGGGTLPFAVADAVARQGRHAVLFAIRGWADPTSVERYPHHWIAVGQLGRLRRLLFGEGCRELVLIGTLLRPAFWRIRFDLPTLLELPRVIAMFHGGDDHLLGMIGRIFEDQGVRVLGAQDVAPEILVPEGAIGARAPHDRDRADIAHGLAVLAALGRFDIGQAIVVADGYVLALEAAEGTDNMLARVADLRRQGRIRTGRGTGVLVKAAKLGQDRRFDLPTIGPATVERVAAAGLAGLAVVAGETIVAEPQAVAVTADRAGIFVIGLPGAGAV